MGSSETTICIEHPTYIINPFYFYKLQQCAVRHKTWVKKSILTKKHTVGTLY